MSKRRKYKITPQHRAKMLRGLRRAKQRRKKEMFIPLPAMSPPLPIRKLSTLTGPERAELFGIASQLFEAAGRLSKLVMKLG